MFAYAINRVIACFPESKNMSYILIETGGRPLTVRCPFKIIDHRFQDRISYSEHTSFGPQNRVKVKCCQLTVTSNHFTRQRSNVSRLATFICELCGPLSTFLYRQNSHSQIIRVGGCATQTMEDTFGTSSELKMNSQPVLPLIQTSTG